MRLRLLKAWNTLAPGDLIDPDPPVADLLLARGIAEIAEEQKPSEKQREPLARVLPLPKPSEVKGKGRGK